MGRRVAYHASVSSGRRPPYHVPPRPYVSPFRRLARTHALMTAGDVAMVVSLAGSLFFSISPDAARSKVLLYLLVSFAPFAVVAPFIGPFIDRATGWAAADHPTHRCRAGVAVRGDDLPSRRPVAVPVVVRRDDPAEDIRGLALVIDPDGRQQQDRARRGQLQARIDLRRGRRPCRGTRRRTRGDLAKAVVAVRRGDVCGSGGGRVQLAARCGVACGDQGGDAGPAQGIASLGRSGDELDPRRHRFSVLRAAVLAAREPLQQRVDRRGHRCVDRRV